MKIVEIILQYKKIVSLSIISGTIAIFFYSLWRIGADISSLMGLTLFAMAPLTLAAVGECINQKAGQINIGLEGIMALSGFIGILVVGALKHWGWGIIFGALTGALIGVIFGLISNYAKGDQIIAGLGILAVGAGIEGFLLVEWARTAIFVLPSEYEMPTLILPFIGSISFFMFAAILVAILAHLILFKTLLGVKIRAAGEKPEADDVAGVRVDRIRMLAAIVGGTLAGLAGVSITLWFNVALKGIIGGRGFIAFAIVLFAGARPIWALLGAFLFGLTDAFSLFLDISPVIKGLLPLYTDYFIKMIPFIVPILALIFIPKARLPAALGKPYIRE